MRELSKISEEIITELEILFRVRKIDVALQLSTIGNDDSANRNIRVWCNFDNIKQFEVGIMLGDPVCILLHHIEAKCPIEDVIKILQIFQYWSINSNWK